MTTFILKAGDTPLGLFLTAINPSDPEKIMPLILLGR